jgi:hypothetical protein
LATELTSAAAQRGVIVRRGACYPQEQSLPYAPLLHVIR